MNGDELRQRMESLSEQVGSLLNHIPVEQPSEAEVLEQAFEELNISLEELQVAQEELHQQNEELATARQAVETERQRYQELFEFAPDGYLVTDTQGIIWEVNRAAARLLQVPHRRLVGKPLLLFVAEADRRAFRMQLNQMLPDKQRSEWIVWLQPRDGELFEAALTVTGVYDNQGNLLGWRWLCRDITERQQLEEAKLQAKLAEMVNQDLKQEIERRRQLEEKLRQHSEALAQANRMKDEFLAIVSHELRSPLNAILGWAHLLQAQQLDATTTTRALETIQRNAKAQAQLIEDLLDISRIIRGKLQLTIRPVDLVFVIRTAIDAVQLAANAKAIEIHTALDPVVGLVSGDADRLQQVIWNLLSNAIKFTSQGGQVEIRLERVTSKAVQISVRDTGQGISPEFLPYIFERFRQAEQSTTRMHGGLGLGLAIVRQLVELHGGTVQAESAGVGQGATFTVQLPSATSSENSAAEAQSDDQMPPANAPSLSNIHVLIVEDQSDTRELLTLVLEQSGAKTTAVSSVSEALQVLEQAKPNILVSDIGMPEEDGYALIRQVRALPNPLASVPAIALTAFARETDRKQILASGFQAHLIKPVDPDEFVTIVASQAGCCCSKP